MTMVGRFGGGSPDTFGNMGKPGIQKALLFAGLRVCHGGQTPVLQATQEHLAKQVVRRAPREGFTLGRHSGVFLESCRRIDRIRWHSVIKE